MNTKELIEIARECCSYPVKVSDYHWCGEGEFIFTEAGLNAFAQRIEQPLLELVDQLNKKIDWQIEAISAQQAQIAEYAVLTEENEKLIEVIRQRSHKIAELEKDCEILQTNLDAALMQVRQLRDELETECEELRSLESDIIGYENDEIKLNEQIKQLREALYGLLRCPEIRDGNAERIAHKALEETK